MAKKPWFSLAGSVYFNLVNRLRVASPFTGRGYAYKKYPELVGVFGCEGGKDAPIAFIDGSYLLRDRGNKIITFGIKDIPGRIKWSNAEGFLPCLVSEFEKDGVEYRISNFSDKLTIGGNDFDIAYSRLTVKNGTGSPVKRPAVSALLIPLNERSETIQPGETADFDFAVAADRFGGKYPFPDADEIRKQGGFDEHYEYMKKYWLARLEPLAEITALPEPELIDAYKAGYIYTMICKDGDELHVGENGYDRVFDHDVIGILNTLILLGDRKDIEKYSAFILKNVQYPDARWKYSWFFVLYLQKTGNADFVRRNFGEIKANAHSIASARESGGSGIMKPTPAIDSLGHWTVDNFSALTGLCSYEYICKTLGEKDEEEWAAEEYRSLLAVCDGTAKETLAKYSLDYLPMNMTLPNSETARSDPRDANRLSMFLFGRWSWEAYLFGAEQYGPLVDLTDATYEHSARVRKDVCADLCNFGGYPHGYFCSAYNAGYGGAALRGEKYRSLGIDAYLYMIHNAMSAPYSWWEGVKYPDEKSPWAIPHASGGGGSCPHMWGQSTATKVLFDSLICEKADGTLIIGRGVPARWVKAGNVIEVKKYPVSHGKRVDMRIEFEETGATVTITGDAPVQADMPLPPGNELKINRG